MPSRTTLSFAVLTLCAASLALATPQGVTATSTGQAAPGTPSVICADTIVDQATGNCIEASSMPMLGSLYPLSNSLFVSPTGRVGIGTSAPVSDLHVQRLTGSNPTLTMTGVEPYIRFNDIRPGFERNWALRGKQGGLRFTDFTAGVDRVSIGTDGNVGINQSLTTGGHVTVGESLTIRGGADIVERFHAGENVEPGTVLVIDPENPGKLMTATEAYDSKVAGVVSGAGGVNPGICLSQDGKLDGETLVAMDGRVYVKATAAGGAIRPGDRLTTSSLAGHAMKVTDKDRADGAVIGKAMSTLESGEGLVLVLVNLQ